MAYAHILNMYKAQEVLLFKRCYVLEKVHGTSAHIGFKPSDNPAWDGCAVNIFSGGEKHDRFASLFDQDDFRARFKRDFAGITEMTLFGEAYGGRQQGMSETYGKELRFIGFDVKIDGRWLAVPQMARVFEGFGIEVVPWKELPTDLILLDAERDAPSEVAVRRGCGSNRPREGIVVRPPIEVVMNNDERIIAKHKQESFSERATPQKVVTPEKLKVLGEAGAIAEEWVTEMRMTHVLQKLPHDLDVSMTKRVIDDMVDDVLREAHGEIVDSGEARAAIAKRAAKMFHLRLRSRLAAGDLKESMGISGSRG